MQPGCPIKPGMTEETNAASWRLRAGLRPGPRHLRRDDRLGEDRREGTAWVPSRTHAEPS